MVLLTMACWESSLKWTWNFLVNHQPRDCSSFWEILTTEETTPSASQQLLIKMLIIYGAKSTNQKALSSQNHKISSPSNTSCFLTSSMKKKISLSHARSWEVDLMSLLLTPFSQIINLSTRISLWMDSQSSLSRRGKKLEHRRNLTFQIKDSW